MTRKEAKVKNLTQYDEGTACPTCALKQRYVSNGCCVACDNIRTRIRRKNRTQEQRQHDLDTKRAWRLWTNYELTPEAWDRKYEKQLGKCASCGDWYPSRSPHLKVDHDHTTKVNRALLCNICNILEGVMKNGSDKPFFVLQYIDFINSNPFLSVW